jgi:AraC-like DNA-binding protein
MVGELFTNANVFIAGPRAEHFATVMPGQETFQIFIPAELLANELAARLNREAFDLAGQRYLIRPGTHVVGKLIDIVTQSTYTAQELIDSSPSPETLEQLQKTLVERVVTILTTVDNDLTRERPSFSSTGWVLLRAREYFEEHRRTPIRLADVCRALGVSQRMLQVAFADGLGITPMRYLKLIRLHLVREHLQRTTAEDVAVTLAAREAGFVDLSRFARDYKELFGQLPSETERA